VVCYENPYPIGGVLVKEMAFALRAEKRHREPASAGPTLLPGWLASSGDVVTGGGRSFIVRGLPLEMLSRFVRSYTHLAGFFLKEISVIVRMVPRTISRGPCSLHPQWVYRTIDRHYFAPKPAARTRPRGIFAHAVVLTSYVECLTWVRINGHSVIDSGVDGKPTILNFAFPELMLFRSRLPLGF